MQNFWRAVSLFGLGIVLAAPVWAQPPAGFDTRALAIINGDGGGADDLQHFAELRAHLHRFESSQPLYASAAYQRFFEARAKLQPEAGVAVSALILHLHGEVDRGGEKTLALYDWAIAKFDAEPSVALLVTDKALLLFSLDRDDEAQALLAHWWPRLLAAGPACTIARLESWPEDVADRYWASLTNYLDGKGEHATALGWARLRFAWCPWTAEAVGHASTMLPKEWAPADANRAGRDAWRRYQADPAHQADPLAAVPFPPANDPLVRRQLLGLAQVPGEAERRAMLNWLVGDQAAALSETQPPMALKTPLLAEQLKCRLFKAQDGNLLRADGDARAAGQGEAVLSLGSATLPVLLEELTEQGQTVQAAWEAGSLSWPDLAYLVCADNAGLDDHLRASLTVLLVTHRAAHPIAEAGLSGPALQRLQQLYTASPSLAPVVPTFSGLGTASLPAATGTAGAAAPAVASALIAPIDGTVGLGNLFGNAPMTAVASHAPDQPAAGASLPKVANVFGGGVAANSATASIAPVRSLLDSGLAASDLATVGGTGGAAVATTSTARQVVPDTPSLGSGAIARVNGATTETTTPFPGAPVNPSGAPLPKFAAPRPVTEGAVSTGTSASIMSPVKVENNPLPVASSLAPVRATGGISIATTPVVAPVASIGTPLTIAPGTVTIAPDRLAEPAPAQTALPAVQSNHSAVATPTIAAGINGNALVLGLIATQIDAGKFSEEADRDSIATLTAGDLLRAIDTKRYSDPANIAFAKLLVEHFPDQLLDHTKLSGAVKFAVADYYAGVPDDKCVAFYEELLAVIKQRPLRGDVHVLTHLANFYSAVEDPEKAGEALARITQFTTEPTSIGNSLIESARCFIQAGDSERGQQIYHSVAGFGYGWTTGLSYFDLANSLIEQGNQVEARKLLLQPVSGKFAAQIQVALDVSLADSYWRMRECDKAKQYIDKALAEYKALTDPLQNEGLQEQVQRAQTILDQVTKYEAMPIECNPESVRMLVRQGEKPVRQWVAIQLPVGLALSATCDNPNLKVTLVDGDEDVDHPVLSQEDMRIELVGDGVNKTCTSTIELKTSGSSAAAAAFTRQITVQIDVSPPEQEVSITQVSN